MPQPLISVVVPIYNVELYLDGCVSSIAAQSYENLEMILVDDGSPDGCPAICDAWAKRDSRVKVIHKKNGGLSDARNAGMAAASGEYICFIDSDDRLDREYLQTLYRAMTRLNADIAECGISYVDENGRVLRQRNAQEEKRLDRMEALRCLILEDGVFPPVWNKLYRRSLVADIPFAVGKWNEDEFWTYLVFDRIGAMATVPDPLYHYLQRGSSIIGTGYNIRRLDGLEARFQRMEYLQKYDALASLTRQEFTLYCMWQLQCVLRYLTGDEKARAMQYIFERMEATPAVAQSKLCVNLKYRVWYAMFRAFPILTARIRNVLRIGL